jgi:hypothetical protein
MNSDKEIRKLNKQLVAPRCEADKLHNKSVALQAKEIMRQKNRESFEYWIKSSPYEKSVSRFINDPENTAWPGCYKDINVELAWEAWQESAKTKEGEQ